MVEEIERDFEHSEMFPYAIALAKRRGAKKIQIGEPWIKGRNSKEWKAPDVLGIRENSEKPYIIVECEKSHGNIFDKGGKIDTWSKDEELRKRTEFHFVLRSNAWYRREMVRKYFGDDAEIHNFDELKAEITPVAL